MSILSAGDLPLPWQSVDIGRAASPGLANTESNKFIIRGTGSINGTADTARFAYQTLAGDGEVKARILFAENVSSLGRTGVMIRDNLGAGSAYAFMGIDTTGNYISQRRNSASATPATVTSPASDRSAPIWVRLVRSRGWLSGYKSVDGSNWSLIDSKKVSLSTTIYFGLVSVSGDQVMPATTIFDNVTANP